MNAANLYYDGWRLCITMGGGARFEGLGAFRGRPTFRGMPFLQGRFVLFAGMAAGFRGRVSGATATYFKPNGGDKPKINPHR